MTLAVLAGMATAYGSTIPLGVLVGRGGAAAMLQPIVPIGAGILRRATV
jgi:hypothetical protein